jgi:hypothetical protein
MNSTTPELQRIAKLQTAANRFQALSAAAARRELAQAQAKSDSQSR